MNEARAWIPAVVGALAAGVGCVVGFVLALVFPSGPEWLLPVLMAACGLGLGAFAGVTIRRRLRPRRSGPPTNGQ